MYGEALYGEALYAEPCTPSLGDRVHLPAAMQCAAAGSVTVAASAQQCIKIGRQALRPEDDAIILRLQHASTEMSARSRHSHRRLVVAETIPPVDGKLALSKIMARPAATSSHIDWNLRSRNPSALTQTYPIAGCWQRPAPNLHDGRTCVSSMALRGHTTSQHPPGSP